MCTPIIHQGILSGVLFLENRQIYNCFTPERQEILQLLSSQAAISIEKARLYRDLEIANAELRRSHDLSVEYNKDLEKKVQERTMELKEKNKLLEDEIVIRKQMEMEMRQAKDVAEEATNMKTRFLANMSHGLYILE
jgi:GAF domain-containing protein